MKQQHLTKQEKQKLEEGIPTRIRLSKHGPISLRAVKGPPALNGPRETQGHQKAATRVRDLFSSPSFNRDLEQILGCGDSTQRQERLQALASYHYLDLDTDSPLSQLTRKEHVDLTNPRLDFCRIAGEDSEIDVQAAGLYPVQIRISPFATKRDVLDFLTKRWSDIQNAFCVWRVRPISHVRKRPSQERDDFIWKRRDLPSSTIAQLLESQYPGHYFDYAQVNAILKKLRKRYSGI